MYKYSNTGKMSKWRYEIPLVSELRNIIFPENKALAPFQGVLRSDLAGEKVLAPASLLKRLDCLRSFGYPERNSN